MVVADEEECQELCTVLEREHFPTTPLHSLAPLVGEIQSGVRPLVLLDLDALPVDNLVFRNLKKTNPGACIIGLSSRSFHPELEEAMSKHIHACLGKPVDEDELLFLVKSLYEA